MTNLRRIGWIGTGVMGASMCGHLIGAGYPTTVTNRTPAKAAGVLDAGAVWAETAEEVASSSDVVFTMLGYPEEVERVVLGSVIPSAAPGSVIVDMSTSAPALAVRIGDAAAESGLAALDAPVSGGDIGARNAALSIMVGGPEDAFAAVLPLFQLMGKTVVHQGPHGSGQHTKLVNQTLIAGTMVGICEALLYAQQAGLDPVTVLESVSGGAAGSWALTNLAPRILDGDFAAGFFVDHFVKDMGLALAEAQRMRLAVPGLALVHQLYTALQAQGRGRDGHQSLIHALAALAAPSDR